MIGCYMSPCHVIGPQVRVGDRVWVREVGPRLEGSKGTVR